MLALKYVLPSYDNFSLCEKSCPRDTVNKTVVTPAGLVANFRTDLKLIDFWVTHL